MKLFFQIVLVIGALVGTFFFYKDIVSKNSGESVNVTRYLRAGDTIRILGESSVSAESYGDKWYFLLNRDEKVKPEKYAGGFSKTFELKGDTLTALEGESNLTFKSDQPFRYTIYQGWNSVSLNLFGAFLILVVFLVVAIGAPELIFGLAEMIF